MADSAAVQTKLLIIDDDEAVRDAIKLALHDQAYVTIEVTEAADADQGIALAESMIPDVIILDLHMPGKSGFDFLEIMQGNPALARTRVIILTVDDTMDNVFLAEAKNINPYHFIGKPFEVSQLLAVVYEAIGLPNIKKAA